MSSQKVGTVIGHPGKRGNLQTLLNYSFEGVPAEILSQIRDNISDRVLSSDNLSNLSRNYRTTDVAYIQSLFSYLRDRNGSPDTS